MKHPPTNKLEYSRITNSIYIGTNMCCQRHFNRDLLKKGITVDISLEKIRLDAPFGVEFYAWIPVKDHTAPTQDQLEFGVSVLEKAIKMKKKAYVHCQNGHGRAPTLVAAYFIKQGKNVTDAIKIIKKKRPSIHVNERQKKVLKKLEFRSKK